MTSCGDVKCPVHCESPVLQVVGVPPCVDLYNPSWELVVETLTPAQSDQLQPCAALSRPLKS